MSLHAHKMLVCENGTSHKFYELSLTKEGEIYILDVRYGKVKQPLHWEDKGYGTKNRKHVGGMTQVNNKFEKILREKLRKGYQQVEYDPSASTKPRVDTGNFKSTTARRFQNIVVGN